MPQEFHHVLQEALVKQEADLNKRKSFVQSIKAVTSLIENTREKHCVKSLLSGRELRLVP